MLRCFGKGQYFCYGVSEKIHTDATVFRRGSILLLQCFGEDPYCCYGVSEKVNTHVTPFRRSMLMLRRFE